jgi:hypothetical protein
LLLRAEFRPKYLKNSNAAYFGDKIRTRKNET